MIDERDKAERGIGYVYWWLFWSPLITVSWLAIAISMLSGSTYTKTNWIIPVVTSALPHLVLLLDIRSKYRYRRRHAQQALLLAAVRTLSTLLLMGATGGDGIVWWININGFLWIWGSMEGVRQVRKGESWLMRLMGDDDELPRPWALPAILAQPDAAPIQAAQPDTPGQLPQPTQRAETIETLMKAFHEGSPEQRRETLNTLERLGEVELF